MASYIESGDNIQRTGMQILPIDPRENETKIFNAYYLYIYAKFIVGSNFRWMRCIFSVLSMQQEADRTVPYGTVQLHK